MKEITLQEAVQKLVSELKNDEMYRYSWLANIAVCFESECLKMGYKLPDLSAISNRAAEAFIANLTMDVEKKD